MDLLAIMLDVLTYLDLPPLPAPMPAPTTGLSLSKESFEDGASNKATLLGIPQELRNKIVSTNADLSLNLSNTGQFGYLYDTTGTVAKAIDLDLSSKRRKCVPGACELTGYFYYLPEEVHPPTKTPLLICKQLHAEMGKMQDAAFRNYWTANTFKVELCNQSFGGSDHITEEHLRHIHHIACKGKRMRSSVTLHYVFQESWSPAVELTSSLHPKGRMLSLGDIRGYRHYSQLEELSRLPAALQGMYRRYQGKGPLDPSIGQGFTFEELVIFLEALDDVFHTFDDLPGYCPLAALKKD